MLTLTRSFEARIDRALQRSRLLGLSEASRDRLRGGERRLDIPAGTVLPLPCDEPHLGLVVDGVLRVSIASPQGRVATLRYLRPGDLIGVPSLVGQATTIADFRAVVDTTVLVFDVDGAVALARTDPTFALSIAEEIGLMLRTSIAGLAAMAFGSIRQRVAAHLLDLAVSSDGHGRRVARVSQQELADAIGSVRDVVARSLGDLRDDGRVATLPGRIVILDAEGLADLARGDEAPAPPEPISLAG